MPEAKTNEETGVVYHQFYRQLTEPIFRRGKGLHSGEDCALSIEPADRLLLELGGQCLPLSRLVLDGSGRGSDLIFPDGKRARTCEHVLSALAGLGVWGAKLVLTGESDSLGESGAFEMPALDGCAEGLAGEIIKKSISSGPSKIFSCPEPLRLRCPVRAGDFFSGRFVIALPSPSFRVTYVIDYDAAPVGTQIFDYGGTPEEYLKAIAPARTFVMKKDFEALRAAGLARGGSLDNAILVSESAETTGGLRFPDEFVRHKVLDLLGDLANLGRPLAAHIVAVRAGHVQHLQLVERLRALSRTEHHTF